MCQKCAKSEICQATRLLANLRPHVQNSTIIYKCVELCHWAHVLQLCSSTEPTASLSWFLGVFQPFRCSGLLFNVKFHLRFGGFSPSVKSFSSHQFRWTPLSWIWLWRNHICKSFKKTQTHHSLSIGDWRKSRHSFTKYYVSHLCIYPYCGPCAKSSKKYTSATNRTNNGLGKSCNTCGATF